MAEFEVLKAQ